MRKVIAMLTSDVDEKLYFKLFFTEIIYNLLHYNFRSKNTVNILIKNLLDCLFGSITYWIVGWAVAYGKGGNGFIGGSNYFGLGIDQEDYPLWFFKFVFAATAATIVSGAIAERCQFVAYLVYSITFTGGIN